MGSDGTSLGNSLNSNYSTYNDINQAAQQAITDQGSLPSTTQTQLGLTPEQLAAQQVGLAGITAQMASITASISSGGGDKPAPAGTIQAAQSVVSSLNSALKGMGSSEITALNEMNGVKTALANVEKELNANSSIADLLSALATLQLQVQTLTNLINQAQAQINDEKSSFLTGALDVSLKSMESDITNGQQALANGRAERAKADTLVNNALKFIQAPAPGGMGAPTTGPNAVTDMQSAGKWLATQGIDVSQGANGQMTITSTKDSVTSGNSQLVGEIQQLQQWFGGSDQGSSQDGGIEQTQSATLGNNWIGASSETLNVGALASQVNSAMAKSKSDMATAEQDMVKGFDALSTYNQMLGFGAKKDEVKALKAALAAILALIDKIKDQLFSAAAADGISKSSLENSSGDVSSSGLTSQQLGESAHLSKADIKSDDSSIQQASFEVQLAATFLVMSTDYENKAVADKEAVNTIVNDFNKVNTGSKKYQAAALAYIQNPSEKTYTSMTRAETQVTQAVNAMGDMVSKAITIMVKTSA